MSVMTRAWLAIFLLLVPMMFALAQTPASAQAATSVQTSAPAPAASHVADRQQALEFFDANQFEQALPLLEKVVADAPDDSIILERLGMCRLAHAATMTDPEKRKAERQRARAALLKAKELGNNSNLLQTLLNGTREDGADPAPFSSHAEAEAMMRAGEAAFARGQMQEAVRAYQGALLLDGNLYEAAVFSGDVYYKLKQHGSAGEWFARAIQINPDRETAYRYWGDALIAQGRLAEAREKFIDAIVADPYNQDPWMGTSQWANHVGAKLNRVSIKSPNSFEVKPDGNATITLTPRS